MSNPIKSSKAIDDMTITALYVMHNGWKAVKGDTRPDADNSSGIGGAAQDYSKLGRTHGAGRYDRYASDGVIDYLCREGRRR